MQTNIRFEEHRLMSSIKKTVMSEPPCKKQCLSRSLAHASAQTVFKLQQLALGKLNSSDSKPSGAFRRKVEKMLEPAKNCYTQVSMFDANGKSVSFSVANLEALMNYMAEHSATYRDALSSIDSQQLSFLWYADETTGGNVLATSAAKSSTLFYIAAYEVQHLNSAEAWLPIALVTARDLRLIPGGLSAVCAKLVGHFSTWHFGGLRVVGRHFRVSFKAFVGDYDAVEKLLAAKGTAALKPCCLCMNCVSRQSDVPAQDSYFQSITCTKFHQFRLYKQHELNESYDRLLAEAPGLNKGDRDEQERIFGFYLDSNTVMASASARNFFTLDKIVLDSMHIYFANGVCAQELVLLQQALQTRLGINLEQLCQSIQEVEWVCQSSNFRSASARKYLFHPPLWSGSMYKGNGSAVWFLVPLVGFYASKLSSIESLPELESFYRLLEVVQLLKQIRRGAEVSSSFLQAQEKHFEAFLKCYSEEETRPKHHLALHLSRRYRLCCYVDCWPTEARHRMYKHQLCDDLQGSLKERRGEFSAAVLRRLLRRCAELQSDRWSQKLAGKCFEREVVEHAAGTKGRLSTRYEHGSLALSQNEVLFVGDTSAGWIHFFVEDEGEFFVFVERLQEISATVRNTRVFRKTNETKAIQIHKSCLLWQPAWWTVQDPEVLCLL